MDGTWELGPLTRSGEINRGDFPDSNAGSMDTKSADTGKTQDSKVSEGE